MKFAHLLALALLAMIVFAFLSSTAQAQPACADGSCPLNGSCGGACSPGCNCTAPARAPKVIRSTYQYSPPRWRPAKRFGYFARGR